MLIYTVDVGLGVGMELLAKKNLFDVRDVLPPVIYQDEPSVVEDLSRSVSYSALHGVGGILCIGRVNHVSVTSTTRRTKPSSVLV